MKIIDISLEIKKDMIIYPGNPFTEINPLRRIPFYSSALSEIVMGSHTGTHIDTELHVMHGNGIENIPFDKMIGTCQVLDMAHCDDCITKYDLERKNIYLNKVLLKTKNSINGYDKFNENYIYLAEDAAEYLIQMGTETLGVDYISVQKYHQGNQNTHKRLLSNLILFEGLNLKEAEEKEYTFIGLPLKINHLDGVPSRAVLIENS